MTISIIIPYYKNARVIKRTLQSVVCQTYQDFEILIINDASPDWNQAIPIINSFEDNRIHVISHASNKNGSAARNTGINAAQGEYIAFLDADDEWQPNHLKDSLTYIDKYNLDLSTSKVKLINQNGVFFSPIMQKSSQDSVATYLFVKGMTMYTPTIFCKSSLAKEVLFDPSIKRHQDFDFLLRVERKNYKIGTSSHLGAIVHWENNVPTEKGETWSFSQDWLENRKNSLNNKEFDNFWLQFVGFKIIKQSKWLFVKHFFKNKINPININKSRARVLLQKFL